MISNPKNLRSYVQMLHSQGRYTFKKAEALAALKVSPAALKLAAGRLIKKGELASPRRGFFVIVPNEYLTLGAPPAEWFIHDLMSFHKQPYYVGLLSAAVLHGAGHQQPQVFQVVTTKALRPIEVGRSRIHFFINRHLENTPTMKINSPTGYLTISTPEGTALDLLRYLESVGHLSNAATVLKDLSERIRPSRLLSAAKADAELSVVQRVGYILDFLGKKDLTRSTHKWCAKQDPVYIPLSPGPYPKKASKNTKWRILENEEIEVDF